MVTAAAFLVPVTHLHVVCDVVGIADVHTSIPGIPKLCLFAQRHLCRRDPSCKISFCEGLQRAANQARSIL